METKVCKKCKRELSNTMFGQSISKGRLRLRSYCIDCHAKVKNRPKDRRLHNHGMTELHFGMLMYEQNHACAICYTPFEGIRICVDHDHKTGRLRSLLCNNCNSGLGQFKDDPERLSSAINYLKSHTASAKAVH